MRTLKVLSALALPLAAVCSSPAAAAVTVSSAMFNTGYDPTGAVLVDFDHALPAGVRIVGGLVRASDDGLGAPPAMAPGVKGASAYLSVNPGDPAVIMSDVGFRTVSFLWGSMDSYNTLRLLGADGMPIASYSGLDVYAPATGDQLSGETNRRVTFSVEGGQAIFGLALESSQPAFEVDDLIFSSAVPEPATWAMMIVGFGAVGGSMRRRSQARAASAA